MKIEKTNRIGHLMTLNQRLKPPLKGVTAWAAIGFLMATLSAVFGPALAVAALNADVSKSAPSSREAGGVLSLQAFQNRPKLALVLVIDQFRADYLTRFESRFLPARLKNGEVGGFRYLMERGAFFPAARYDILQSMTCPGHAEILSGSYPYTNKIVLNNWHDETTGKSEYCVSDPEFGVSPLKFSGSTVGDELKNAGYPSQVVAIALKDRAAVLLGGKRADLALWLEAGQWTSSRFYLRGKELPAWAKALNESLEKKKGAPYVWKEQAAPTGFSLAGPPLSRKTIYGAIDSLRTPLGLAMTVDAALAAAAALRFGRSPSPDLLAISFSSHDMMGHIVGPNAPEMEDLAIAEDREISRLLNGLKASLPGGLDQTLISLTGDHGMAPNVPFLQAGHVDAGFIDSDKAAEDGERNLTAKFGAPPAGRKWITAAISFNFYFDVETLRAKKIARIDAENELKAEFVQIPGVAYVISRSDYDANRLPPGFFERQIKKSYVPGRSGDLILIPKPFYMQKTAESTHMTGYAYDRTVPLLLSGLNVRKGVFATSAEVVDLAPTLSFLLGVLPPALSEGRILSEALGNRP